MTTFRVDDIQSEVHWLEDCIKRNMRDFEALLNQCPISAMGLMDKIAADRTKVFRLSMLMHALSSDWETWEGQTIDERMCVEQFQRVSPHQSLYVRHQRKPDPGVELCDLFDIIHIKPQAIEDLIGALRRR